MERIKLPKVIRSDHVVIALLAAVLILLFTWGHDQLLVWRIEKVIYQMNDNKTAGELRNYSAVAKPIYEWLENGKNGVRETQDKK